MGRIYINLIITLLWHKTFMNFEAAHKEIPIIQDEKVSRIQPLNLMLDVSLQLHKLHEMKLFVVYSVVVWNSPLFVS